ncbi:MAG: protein phosphatase 2C domain-containing protein [Desulfobacterales bacterium]
MIVTESAGLTDTGNRRKDNEDALLVDDGLGLYIVADGMGGHRAGEVASRLVIESMRRHIECCRDGRVAAEKSPSDTTLSLEANQVLAGILSSNRAVHTAANGSGEYRGMGTTVALLKVSDRTLVAANVGDSSIFLVQKGLIERLSVLHTVMAEHEVADPLGTVRLGAEFSHVLTRAVGVNTTVEAHICEVPCFAGDVFVISSDGLTDMVTPDEILATVAVHPPAEACRRLVDLANDRGGTDNITVIVLAIKKNLNGESKLKSLLSRVSESFASLGSKKQAVD